MTPASSWWLQLCGCHPQVGHLHIWDTSPLQFTSSSQMGPDPLPKEKETVVSRASPQPSCLYNRRASSRSQPSSQMVPQEPWSRISTLPEQRPPPSTRRICLLSEQREMGHQGLGRVFCPVGPPPHQSSRGRSPLRLPTLLIQLGLVFLYQWQENNKVEE